MAGIGVGLDLMDQNIAAPTIFSRVTDVIEACFVVLDLFQDDDIMAPGDLCHSLWHKFTHLLVTLVFANLGNRAGDPVAVPGSGPRFAEVDPEFPRMVMRRSGHSRKQPRM